MCACVCVCVCVRVHTTVHVSHHQHVDMHGHNPKVHTYNSEEFLNFKIAQN